MITDEQAADIRASLARTTHRAAELMIAHDDVPNWICIQTAWFEECLLYGVPGQPKPVGILHGRSYLQSLGVVRSIS